MIQTELKSLEKALKKAIDTAKEKQAPQLLSVTEEIESVDPIVFFDQAKHIDGDRVFWTSSSGDFYLVGTGNAHEIQSNTKQFDYVEKEWQLLIDNALIVNPYQEPGTGPIALGGFSFDTKKNRTPLWEHFQGSHLRVPAYLLTIVNNKFYLTTNIVVCEEDHDIQLFFTLKKNQEQLLLQTPMAPTVPKIKSKREINPEGWKDIVVKATEQIKEGIVDKIVLAREMRVTFERKTDISPVINQLVNTQTHSYIFAFENEEECFLGATPERLVQVEGNRLLSTCLAGTAPRGKTLEEDKRIAEELLHDEKNREEHEFVVQMIRDAIDVCCEDIEVPERPIIYPLKNLQHLYTPVEAKLKSEFSILDVVKRLHPTPALGGKPTNKSLNFIREFEELDRGWYGAPIGWLDANGNGEFAVAIRSALVKGTEASLFAGCGVVKDSDPEAEYKETTIKFTPMLSVLGG